MNPAIWIPELDQEGAVYGPHELAGTPTPLAGSVRSFETTESPDAGERELEMENPGSTFTPMALFLRSHEATESHKMGERISKMADPSGTPTHLASSPRSLEDPVTARERERIRNDGF